MYLFVKSCRYVAINFPWTSQRDQNSCIHVYLYVCNPVPQFQALYHTWCRYFQNLNTTSTRARVAVMYLFLKSCGYVAINFPWTSQRDQNFCIYQNFCNLVPQFQALYHTWCRYFQNLNTPSTRARVAVMYLCLKSCRYVTINFPWTSQRDQNSCIYLNVCNLVPQFQALYHTLCRYFRNLNTPPTTARVAFMYLFVKSGRHVAINFPWTSERDQNSCIYPNFCNLVPQFQALYHTWCRYLQNLNTPPTRARVAVMYLFLKSCLYVAINFPWTSQRDQNSCIYLNVCNLVPQFQALYHTLCRYFQNLNTLPTRARAAIMYLFVKSCRYVAISFPWTSERDQNSCIYPNVCKPVPQFHPLYQTWCRYFQNLNTPSTRARVAVMYLFLKSCGYVAINFPWKSKRDQNSCIYPNVCNPVPQFQPLYYTLCRYFQNRSTPPTRARVAVMYLFLKSCRYVAINIPWTSQRD